MSAELPPSPGSINDYTIAFIEANQLGDQPVTQEVVAEIYESYFTELEAYRFALMSISNLDREQLHANPNWHLRQAEEQVA